MSKFCTKCGRPLQEGEVCTCQNEQVSQQTTQNGQAQFQQPINQQQVPPSGFSLYIKRFWDVATKTMKSPASMLRTFVKANDFKLGLGFIGVNAAIFSLFIVILFGKVNSIILSLTNLFGRLSSMGLESAMGMGSSLSFPLFKIFLVTFVLSFGGACVLAALLLFFTKVIFKFNADYKQMLCVASSKSLASIPFSLVACLFAFVMPTWSIFIVSFGALLGYFYVAAAIKGAGIVDEDKLTYILFLSFAAMVIVTAIVMQVSYKMYLPSVVSDGLGVLKGFGY